MQITDSFCRSRLYILKVRTWQVKSCSTVKKTHTGKVKEEGRIILRALIDSEGSESESHKECAVSHTTAAPFILVSHLEMFQITQRTHVDTAATHPTSCKLSLVCLSACILTSSTGKRDFYTEIIFTLILKFLACRSAKTRKESKKSHFQPFSTFPKLWENILPKETKSYCERYVANCCYCSVNASKEWGTKDIRKANEKTHFCSLLNIFWLQVLTNSTLKQVTLSVS